MAQGPALTLSKPMDILEADDKQPQHFAGSDIEQAGRKGEGPKNCTPRHHPHGQYFYSSLRCFSSLGFSIYNRKPLN